MDIINIKIRLKIKAFILASLLALSYLLAPINVFAIDEGFYSSNDILFYKPGVECNSSTPESSTNKGSLYVVGDSYTRELRDNYGFENDLKSAGFEISAYNASGGRSITAPGTDGDKTTGLAALDKDKSAISGSDSALVILGTNGVGSNSDDPKDMDKTHIKQFMDKLHSANPNIKTYWVNLSFIGNNGKPFDVSLANKNLSDNASELGYTVIDWRAQTENNMSKYLIDKHPNPEGWNLLKQTILNALSASPSRSITGNTCAVGAACTSLLTPTINDQSGLGKVIDDYITKTVKEYDTSLKSPFEGLGIKFVEGAVAAGVNPFIAVLHAHIESIFATYKTNGWHNYTFATANAAVNGDQSQRADSFNAFGRMAGSTQPTVWYPSGPRPVYKWASWEDSLNGTDSFNVYYKRKWIDEAGYTTFDQVVKEYAPASDGNDTIKYINFMNNGMNKLIGLAGDTISCGTTGQGGSGGSNDYLTGDETIKLKSGYYLKNGSPKMIYYSQNDERWNNPDPGIYYNGSVAGCGCFPTAMAMAINTMGPDKNITPLDVGKVVRDKGAVYEGCGYGGSDDWPVDNLPSVFNIQVKKLSNIQQAMDGIASGGLVVMSVTSPSPFTSESHYIVLRGITNDGKIAVADPIGSHADINLRQSWTPAQMQSYRTSSSGKMWLISAR